MEKPTIPVLDEKSLLGLIGSYFDTPMLKEKILPAVISKIKLGEKNTAYEILKKKGGIVVGGSKFDSNTAQEVIDFIEEFLNNSNIIVPEKLEQPKEEKSTEKEDRKMEIIENKEKKIETPIEISENIKTENKIVEDRVKQESRVTKPKTIEEHKETENRQKEIKLEQPVTGVYHTNYEQDLLVENKKDIEVPYNIYKTQINQTKEVKEMFDSTYEKNGFDENEEPLYKNRNRKSDHIDVEDPWADIENNSSLKINSKNNMAKENTPKIDKKTKPQTIVKSFEDLAKLKNNPEEGKVSPNKKEEKVDLKISPARKKTEEIKKSLDALKEKNKDSRKTNLSYNSMSPKDKLLADFTETPTKTYANFKKELDQKNPSEILEMVKKQEEKIVSAINKVVGGLYHNSNITKEEMEKLSLSEKIEKYNELGLFEAKQESKKNNLEKQNIIERNKNLREEVKRHMIVEMISMLELPLFKDSKYTKKDIEQMQGLDLEELIGARNEARKRVRNAIFALREELEETKDEKRKLEIQKELDIYEGIPQGKTGKKRTEGFTVQNKYNPVAETLKDFELIPRGLWTSEMEKEAADLEAFQEKHNIKKNKEPIKEVAKTDNKEELTPVIDSLDLESLSLEELQDIYTKNMEIINQHDIKIAGLEKELTDLENNLKLEEQKKLHLENGVAYIKMLQEGIVVMEGENSLDEDAKKKLDFYKEKLQAYEDASFEEAETIYMSKEDLDKLFVSKEIPEIKVDEVVDGRTINKDNIEEAEVVENEEEDTSTPETTPTIIKSIAEKIIKKEKLTQEEDDIQKENYEEIDAIVVTHLKKLLDKAKKDNENLINETQEEKELIIKLKNKFEDLKKKLPTYQENTRTQATQDLLDFAAELYNVPKYTEGLESGKYVSWLQSFKPEGYNASLYLNSPQKALEELSRYLTLLEKTL